MHLYSNPKGLVPTLLVNPLPVASYGSGPLLTPLPVVNMRQLLHKPSQYTSAGTAS